MKKVSSQLALMGLVLLCLIANTTQAQPKKSNDKKIVIIEKTTDENGKERIETITKENGKVTMKVTIDGVEVPFEPVKDIEIIEEDNGDKFFHFEGFDDFHFEGFENFRFEGLDSMNFEGIWSEKNGYLGVMLKIENQEAEDDETAVITITEVFEGSPAATAGLKAGDVVLALEGEEMTELEDFVEAIREHQAGDVVKIKVSRDGAEQTFEAILTEKTEKRFPFKEKNWAWTKDSRGRLGITLGDEKDGGVQIAALNEDGAAREAGLLVGDIITAIDAQKTDSKDALLEALKDKKIGDVVTVEYLRNEVKSTVSVTLRQANARRIIIKGDDKNVEWEGDENDWVLEWGKGEDRAVMGVYLSENDRKGVKLDGVKDGGAADKAGLKSGDRIQKLDDEEVKDNEAFRAALNRRKSGDVVAVTYERGGETKVAQVTLESAKSRIRKIGDRIEGINIPDRWKERVIIVRKGESEQETPTPTYEEVETPEIPTDHRLELIRLEMFPNPTQGGFSLNFESEDTKTPVQITIVDRGGNEVLKQEISDFNGTFEGRLDITGKPVGVYFLNIAQGDKRVTKKLILQ